MKCNKCSNEATTHIRQSINGEVTELWLCSECAEKMGVGGMFSGFGGFGSFSSFDSLFGGFDSLLGSFLGSPSVKTLPAQTRCSVCGSSFSDIAERGKAGCANCYDTFASQLRPTIERIHGRASHAGKLPGKAAPAAGEKAGEKKSVFGGRAKNDEAKRPAEDTLGSLKAELQKAIAAEEYEKAAELRDKIRAMENN